MSTAARPAVRIALDFYDTAPWFERLIGQPDLPCDVDFIRVGYGDAAAAVASSRADLGVVVAPVGQQQAVGAEPIADDVLVGVVRVDHPAAKRGLLDPSDVADGTYLTAGDRPSHGFEHHEFFEPAGVRPLRLRKVESLAMILRLIRTFGGVTVQPALSLQTAILDGLAVVPLRAVEIRVEWATLLRAESTDNEREMADAIRTLCASDLSDVGPGNEAVPEWSGP
jgi:DNA-binding transcriptional LysR family regulator